VMDARYENWVQRWQAALNACQRKGGETSRLVIMPPASEEAVSQIEAELGVAMPASFRRVLTHLSAHVEVHWKLTLEAERTQELRKVRRGNCSWSLPGMVEIARNYQLGLETFPDINDPYDVVWHDKLAFANVPNGDQLAFDLKFMPDPPVVYLSHDDGEAHGYVLGSNFVDFMERWSLLGCPGNEDWQMMPFLPDATSGLDAYGENARKWREWFGLDFEVSRL